MSIRQSQNRPSSAQPLDNLPVSVSSLAEPPSLPRFLTALPVYNEATHVSSVLNEVARYSNDILAVDDGSTDGTSDLLDAREDVCVIHHASNLGYGAALRTAFQYAITHQYEVLLTIDCDRQHEPQLIQQLVAACDQVDIVSGSRYLELKQSEKNDRANTEASKCEEHLLQVPKDRRRINLQVTGELNDALGLQLTDAFCGLKAYRVDSLAKLHLTEAGYAMPLELWVEAAHHNLRIMEVPVPLIYLEEERSFGGSLDDAMTRFDYYRTVIARARARYWPVDSRQDGNSKQDSNPKKNITEENTEILCKSGARQCS